VGGENQYCGSRGTVLVKTGNIEAINSEGVIPHVDRLVKEGLTVLKRDSRPADPVGGGGWRKKGKNERKRIKECSQRRTLLCDPREVAQKSRIGGEEQGSYCE